jgi:hypothetical protein
MAILPAPSSLPAEVSTINATFYEDILLGRPAVGSTAGSRDPGFDIFIPIGGAASKPLVIYFHAGGFTSGTEDELWLVPDRRTFLEELIVADIAVATVKYRLVEVDEPPENVSLSLNDAVSAVQYMRFHATELGIDKARVACTGKSAGSGISMFLCGKDFQLTNNTSYRGESSRPNLVACRRPQPLDVVRWERYFTSFTFEDMLAFQDITDLCYAFYGLVPPIGPGNRSAFLTDEIRAFRRNLDTIQNFNPAGIHFHVVNSDSTAEPTTLDALIHHPNFSQKWKDIADEVGGITFDYYTSEPPTEEDYDFIINNI